MIELFRHAVLVACLAGLIVCTLALSVISMLGKRRAGLFLKLRRCEGIAGLVVLAVVMLFNAYPTQADKNRGNNSGRETRHEEPGEPPRSGTDSGVEDISFSLCSVTDYAEAPEFPVWTNALESLQITGLVIEQTSVWMRVSWPISESIPSYMLDVFSASDCDTNSWTLCGTIAVPVSTNEVVIEAFVSDSTIAAIPRHFFRVGTKVDSDADDLTDAFEHLVSHTSPSALDSDGDDIPDGWEYENGLDPNLWFDAYADPDEDGIPNLYEFHNGTQPQVADAEEIDRIVAGGSGSNAVATLSAALAQSRPYSVIEIADGIYEGDGWSGRSITLPDYPVLITSSDGGRSRRAVIRHADQLAAMYLNATQTTHTVVQGLCYDLAATNGMQMAFWCGGNLPWSGPPAGGMFRDVYVRMSNPGVEYQGWFFRHYESNEVVIASCTVNAYGATRARGIYAIDSPPMSIENCTFVNFPSNDVGLGYGIQYESTALNWGAASDPIPLEIVNCLFDVSFTNANALAPLENGVAYDVTMLNCIVPSPLEFEADYTAGLIMTNAGVSFSGHISETSPARGAGLESLLAPLDIDGESRTAPPDIGADHFVLETGARDTDGDGIPDVDEDWIYGTDPYFADSDWDGSPDNAEIANGTDPLNRLSHLANVTLSVTNISTTANLTNYFGFSSTPMGWDVTNAFAATRWGQASIVVSDTTGLYGKAFSDLNRNGVYDEDADVMQIVDLESEYAIVNETIALGDIDGEGVSDFDERVEGTNPYDADNFLLSSKIVISDEDTGVGITNYFSHSLFATNTIPLASNAFISASYTYQISCATVEGRVYVRGFRDLNRNGVYDEGIDGIYLYDLWSIHRGNTIQLTIGDSDNDTIVDSIEIAEGTSPLDRRHYCFNCQLEIYNIFSTTNNLLAEVYFGQDRIYGPELQTNECLMIDFDHLTTTNGEFVCVYFWDDINGNLSRESSEPCTLVQAHVMTHQTIRKFLLELGGFDADNNGLPEWWQDYFQLQDGELVDTDGDGLVNLHEWWAGTNPLVPDGSNTVLSLCCRSIDERILNKEPLVALSKFNPYANGNWVENKDFWAKDVDTSCASFWNSAYGRFRAGTLLTARHMLFANHFPPNIGSAVYFKGVDGVTYTNTIAATERVGTSDILIALLASEVPSAVTPAYILPENFGAFIHSGLHLPVCQFDYNEKALVYELASALAGGVLNERPKQENRQLFYEYTKSGDSGDPVFLVLSDKSILLGALYRVNGVVGDGRYACSLSPFVTDYANEIQCVMDQLCTGYNLNFFDFSGYNILPLNKGGDND